MVRRWRLIGHFPILYNLPCEPTSSFLSPSAQVAAMMGGRLRNALSGGGPISSDVQTFVRTVFGCNMVQGYALTETCSIGCIQPMDDARDGIVGVPLSSVEIKLDSCTEVRPTLTHYPSPSPIDDARDGIVGVPLSSVEIAHAAVSRRPPISLYMIVARTEGDTNVCLSFTGHFLSPCANP
jgi:acyl-CoA synthetase (AMP-forming)/AMP-acid ligase II